MYILFSNFQSIFRTLTASELNNTEHVKSSYHPSSQIYRLRPQQITTSGLPIYQDNKDLPAYGPEFLLSHIGLASLSVF